MSTNKRSFDWLGVPGSGSSSKRPKSPVLQAESSNISNRNPSNATQSLNPASTSSSTNVPRPGAPVGGQANSTGHSVLLTFKGSMKLLLKGCQVFSPLKSTVKILLEVLEAIETTKQGSEELRETVSNLAQWATVLSDYLSESHPDSEEVSDFVKKLEESLSEQAKYIQTQQQSGKLKRLWESRQEVERLERCYRHIETSFRQFQTDVALRTWKISDDHLKESRLNALNPAHDALYNSSFSDKIERSGCLENTRGSVLDGIRGWIFELSGAKIYWTNGMAGTGKTTIAYSVCTELERDGRLGASFFCSRASSECSDVSRILPTIAYQLAQQFSPFRSSLCRILGQKPSIGRCNISVQFEHLIETPLTEVAETLPNGHVIVIDALDECSNPRTVEMMLDVLFSHVAKLPIRFFLTSRPEPAIANAFLARDNHFRSILHLHNVEEQFVKADIETYLTTKLAKLSLGRDQIKQLAEQAGVLFIYAATLTKYVLATTTGADAATRLVTALTGSKNRENKKDREIDLLYKAILDGVLGQDELEEDEIKVIKHVLWTVVCVREPVTVGTLATLLNLHCQQVSTSLQSLRSILHVSEGNEVVSTLHASFPEFMLSPKRSGQSLYCNKIRHHEYLARQCFKLMEEQLQFNICGLETSYRFDNDVLDLEDRVDDCISSGLSYACRYWVEHLRQLSADEEFLTCLDIFLHEQLLFWMEVINLRGWMDDGPKILAEAQEWLTKVDGSSNTRHFVRDAHHFVTTFAANPVRQSTPHIYISALPLVPRRNKVWESYWGRTRGLMLIDGMLASQRNGAAFTMWEVGYGVTAISYSSGGTRIVLGGDDGTIEIRDAFNGDSLGRPFKGHTDLVTSVAFSSGGTLVASGSYDCTIQVWNAYSGTPLDQPFEAHTDAVASVAFSPDSTLIVSGSWDCTIRVWNVHSRAPLGSPFEAHTEAVASVAFSPDGTRIASGSYDCTVRMWDVRSGTALGSPFKGHTGPVTSVAFSHNGTLVVSGSHDSTVRVWHVHSGAAFGSPFRGHTDWVTSVSFSPDNIRIVAGSWDSTIRMWDLHCDATPSCTFKGHASGVTSVAFSPGGEYFASGSYDGTVHVRSVHNHATLDGPYAYNGHSESITSVTFSSDCTLIVSGSHDHTVRVWDARSGAPLSSPLKGHASGVSSVACSPDSTIVVSGSWDHTIRMWDIHNGVPLGSAFEGHTEPVTSVAFSSDGALVVSGSYDCTIRVWDVRSGALLGSPFEGHTGCVTSVAFSPGGTLIVSGSLDCTLRIWDVHNGIIPGSPFIGHARGVTSVAFSPDGTRIASGSCDSTIQVWDMHNGTPLISPLKGHTNTVSSVAFSPDGTHIVSGSRDRTVWVWDVQGGVPLGKPFEGHAMDVTSVAFSSDGTLILSGSQDCTVRVWDVYHGILQGNAVTIHTSPTTSAAHIVTPEYHRIRSEDVIEPDHSWATQFSRLGADKAGWIVGSTSNPLALIFWLPSALCNVFPMPPNILSISQKGPLTPDFTHLLLGESWIQCYKPFTTPGHK